MANVPIISWNETLSEDTEAISLGDDRIREFKGQIREILEIDHLIENTGQGSNWGFHNKLTLIEKGSNPTPVADSLILFTKEVNSHCELHFIDEDGNVMQLTSQGKFIGGMNYEIRMWSGLLANIPTGWILCDDTPGRVNLIGKFIKSTYGNNPGTTGGSDSITLTTSNLPAHSHGGIISSSGSHAHDIYKYNSSGSTVTFSFASSLTDGWGHDSEVESSSSHTHTLANYGSGSSFDNRPAYVELAFIQKG